jgi:hypothetical protein
MFGACLGRDFFTAERRGFDFDLLVSFLVVEAIRTTEMALCPIARLEELLTAKFT